MKENPDKCHLITSNSDEVSICVENYKIKSSKCEKPSRIKIDNKLIFSNHIDETCKNAGQKLNALSRVTPCLDEPKRRMLLNVFFFTSIQLKFISLDVSWPWKK